jgi:hypothetical protein
MSRQNAVAVFAATACAVSLAVPALASAKGDATATIQSPTRCDAAAGRQITIRFVVTMAEADGTLRPFTAPEVFVRLKRAGRAPAVKRRATSLREGRYRVRVTVPRGGIRRIDAGVEGTTTLADGTTRSAPALLRVVGDPCRSAG